MKRQNVSGLLILLSTSPVKVGRWKSSINPFSVMLILHCLTLSFNCSQNKNGDPSFSSMRNEQSSISTDYKRIEKDTIHVLANWNGEGSRQIYQEEMLREFNFLNQHLHVDLTYPDDMPEIKALVDNRRHSGRSKYVASMIRNNNYRFDVIPIMGSIYTIVGEELGDMEWGEKHLVDFAKNPEFLKTQKPFLLKNSNYLQNTKGFLAGPFIEGAYYLLYYNRELTEKMNLDVKRHGMTIEDLTDYVEKIQQYNRLHGTNIVPIYESSDWITMMILFEHLFKSEIGITDFQQLPSAFTAENRRAYLKIFRLFERLHELGAFSKNLEQVKWGETQHYPLDDRVVFYLNGAWMFNIWEMIDREKLKKMQPAELPVIKPYSYYPGLYIMDYAVLKNGANAEGAIQFLMHWCTRDASEEWTRYAKSPSGIIGHLTATGIGGDDLENFTFALDRKYGERVNFFDSNLDFIFGTQHNVPLDQQGNNVLSVINGTQSAEQAYQNILSFFD